MTRKVEVSSCRSCRKSGFSGGFPLIRFYNQKNNKNRLPPLFLDCPDKERERFYIYLNYSVYTCAAYFFCSATGIFKASIACLAVHFIVSIRDRIDSIRSYSLPSRLCCFNSIINVIYSTFVSLCCLTLSTSEATSCVNFPSTALPSR